ncbi:hypothetical protein TRFO_02489 [Tritrichomonas foetus]|uniref:Rap-GAP domain-containing protein n=1 Tax=Tritrichomonas foetus TaxID=1144522 RepID=A0A1J4L1S4_9EUKA|nr:hypothetical protein TRFO_02489 [Tritrichomonas foetus]|eukprot:OHT17471.1 hypothetical protein TRFO_02489 [Tritrichomonas foetus]
MTTIQTDQQLLLLTRKLISHYDAQQSQGGVKIDKIMPLLENAKQVCSIYPPISEQQVKPETLDNIKLLFTNFYPYLSDPTLSDHIFQFFVRALAALSFAQQQVPLLFKSFFHQYFFESKKQNAMNLFIATLREFNSVNLIFWWTLLCTKEADEQYLEDLKKFVRLFLKTPTQIIKHSIQNTIIYLLKIIQLNSNISTKREIIRNSLLSTFSIIPKSVDPSNVLSAFRVEGSDSRVEALTVLKLVKEQEDDDLLITILRSFAQLTDNFDVPKSQIPKPDQAIDPNEFNSEDGSWILETLRLRYILSLVNINQTPHSSISYNTLFNEVVEEMTQPVQKKLLIFAAQFDSHNNDVILRFAKDPDYYPVLAKFIGHLGVIFAPIFLKIDEKELNSQSELCKSRNKRMKIDTLEAKLMEDASKIYKDPLRFEKYLCEMKNSKCKYPNDSLVLFLQINPESPWTYDEALKYVKDLIVGSPNESELLSIFISRIATIQSYFIYQNLQIDHHFLASNFFDMCISEMSEERMMTAISIVESSSIFEDFTQQQIDKWIDYVLRGLESVPAVASKIVLFCLTHLAPQSFCLCAPFIKANPKPSIEYLTTFSSIYSICFNFSSLPGRVEMMNSVVNICKDFVLSQPRNEVTLGLIITLLFEELSSECPKVSNDLISLVEAFIDQTDAGKPPPSLRMLNIFPANFDLINRKYPTFFKKLVNCLDKILFNPKTSLSLFHLLLDTLVDTLLCMPDDKADSILIFHNLLKRWSEGPRNYLIRSSIDQFMSRFNRNLTEIIPKEKNNTDLGSAYIINGETSLYKLSFEEDDFVLTSKSKTGSSSYTIKSEFSNPPLETEMNNEIVHEDPIHQQKSDYISSFSNYVDDYVNLDSSSVSEFNNYWNDKLGNLRIVPGDDQARPFGKPVPGYPKFSPNRKEKDEGPEVLYQSKHATAFFESINLSHTTGFSIKRPFPLLDIAASNIFQSPARETLKIGFLYVKKDQTDQNSILKNSWDKASPEFKDFIRSIGNIIDLSTHFGFAGKLDNTGYSNGRYQLYFSSDRFEVMYHVAPLLPTDPNDAQQIYKKRHIGNDNVHIVWSEHTFDYEPTTITSQFNDAHIIVYPIPKSSLFYRVVVYKKSDDYHFGPLQGESIVGIRALPTLVRWTSIFSDRASREKTSTNYKQPNQIFNETMKEIVKIKKGNDE